MKLLEREQADQSLVEAIEEGSSAPWPPTAEEICHQATLEEPNFKGVEISNIQLWASRTMLKPTLRSGVVPELRHAIVLALYRYGLSKDQQQIIENDKEDRYTIPVSRTGQVGELVEQN